MSHLALRTLLSDVAKSLGDDIQVDYGRKSEFNMETDKKYPWVWILPLQARRRYNPSTTTRTKLWDVSIFFYNVDKADANQRESANILDEMDSYVDQYLQRLDDWYERSTDTVGALTISNDRQSPVYKENSGIETGWLLQFQVEVSDSFDYCTPDNIALYAGNI